MSRSYKKHGFSSFVCYSSDKPDRTIYHRNERRKANKLLKDAMLEYCEDEPNEGEWCMLCQDGIAYDDYEMGEAWDLYAPSYSPNYNKCYNHKCYTLYNHTLAEDKIITKGIDYSLKYADKYSWASDGGQYWEADISELRKKFDKEVFGDYCRKYKNTKNIWEEYIHYRNASHNKKHRHTLTKYCQGGGIGYWITGPKQANNDWNLMEFLWYRKIIPTTFWGPKDLIEWLTAHEEEILQKWFRMRLLRK